MSKSPNALIEEWFEHVWNQNDETTVPRMMAPDCKILGLNTPSSGPDAFLAFRRSFGNNFDNIRVEVMESMEQHDRAIGHARFTGKHKKTGNPVDIVFSFSVRWENGQAIETRNTVDFTALLAQIGEFDPQTMTNALAP